MKFGLEDVESAIQDRWPKLRILVVGDVMLDAYIWGEVSRVSPEAPIPVVHITQRTFAPGGAANVAMNLAGLGATVTLAGLRGCDEEGDRLEQLLRAAGVQPRLVKRSEIGTTSKTRVMGGHQQMLRLDEECLVTSPNESEGELLATVNAAVDDVDGVVLSDYAKGTLSTTLCREVIAKARARAIPVFVGPKRRDFSPYAGATVICPNRQELSFALGSPENVSELFEQAHNLARNLFCPYLLVTMGEKGIAILRDGEARHVPAQAKQVFDVSGAGDTVLATVAVAILSGLDIDIAAELANVAAGIVVGKVGTVPIQEHELVAAISARTAQALEKKILSRQQLREAVAGWRSNGESIVFANGCFDLLHSGHLALLEAGRREGSRLLVAINSDESMRRLKGSGRPVVPERERAMLIAALQVVDAVTVFEEDTPLECIMELRPDVIVKGGDYSESQVVGHREVKTWNGRVKIVPLVPGKSTSELISRLLVARAHEAAK